MNHVPKQGEGGCDDGGRGGRNYHGAMRRCGGVAGDEHLGMLIQLNHTQRGSEKVYGGIFVGEFMVPTGHNREYEGKRSRLPQVVSQNTHGHVKAADQLRQLFVFPRVVYGCQTCPFALRNRRWDVIHGE